MKRIFTCYNRKGEPKTFEVDITDEYFYQTLYDEKGNPVKVLKEQLEPVKLNGKILYSDLDAPAWAFYESDHGHCGLCGRLECRGGCMGGS